MSSPIPLHNPDTASRLFDGEAVIIAPRANRVHLLNPVASRIWELADGSHTIEDIAQTLAQEFDVTPEHALHSVTTFLRELEVRHLVIWASAA